MTLFASIFAFVTTWPSPPAQSSNQFQANFVVSSSGTSVTAINITHLAGPTVPTSALIYFKSAANPSLCPFTNPIPVWNTSSHKGINSAVWTLGQTWGVPFSQICGSGAADPLPDNITVYIVNNANLLFSVILPGSQITTPPQILSSWVTPSPVYKFGTLVVEATIAGSYKTNSVYLNVANVPGLPTTPEKMVPYRGHWIWNSTGNSSSGPTQTGSYTGFINVSGSNGASIYGTVSIPVFSNGGGIAVSISSVPTSGAPPLAVNFGASVSGANGTLSYSWNFGVGTPYNSGTNASVSHTYTSVGTYLVTLTVTASNGVGSATATITVNYPLTAGAQASGTVSYGYRYSNCNGYFYPTSCPITVYWQVWNNGSQQISISGSEYLNDTTTPSNLGSWSISTTNVAAHSATSKNQIASGVYGAYGDSFTVTLRLTVTIGGTFAGTLSSTYSFTMNG